jgi:acetyl esterase/lipase
MRNGWWLAAAMAVLAGGAVSGGAQERPTLSLWPATPPGDKGGLPPEADLTKPSDNLIAGKRLIRLGNVSTPTLTVYRPPADKATGAAVLVCPGGGYHILALDLEGTEVCDWLNSIGVTAVLLKYRVPRREGRPRHAAPLEDAQRAMGLIRKNAAAWGIDPRRVGVLGFSAGGHLAAAVSTNPERAYPAVDDADRLPARPDFAVVVYPGYLAANDGKGPGVAPELPVSKETPPTFLVQTQDDSVPVESSLYYYLALRQAGVRAELHVYPTGGHGYGLRPTEKAVTHWPKRAEEWLRAEGLLKR